ncbi:MAG: hypothetical protein AAFW69_04795, partial [Pseudomonadota bacterium]
MADGCPGRWAEAGLKLVLDGPSAANADLATVYDRAGPLGTARITREGGLRARTDAPPAALTGYTRLAEARAGDVPSIARVEALADALARMRRRRAVIVDLPAAYTYLGQLLAHDLSTPALPDTDGSVALTGGALDLDSLLHTADRAGDRPGTHVAGGAALGETTAYGGRNSLNDLPRN